MLTISILNYRNWRATAQCIQDLFPACQGLDYRILVRDNSEDTELGRIREAIGDSARVLYFNSAQNTGFGPGHNTNFQVVSHRCGDIFLVLNNDIRVRDPVTIKAMLDACGERRIVSCMIVNAAGHIWFSGGTLNRVTGDLLVRRDHPKSAASVTDFVSGCCLMIPASLYHSLGGFDEAFFMYAEDLDLCLRARRFGVELVIISRTIEHEVGSGEKGQYSDLYLYENTRNRLICLRRHRLGWTGLRTAYFVGKYGLVRTLQLAVSSPDPWTQIRAAWRGLQDGMFYVPRSRPTEFRKPA